MYSVSTMVQLYWYATGTGTGTGAGIGIAWRLGGLYLARTAHRQLFVEVYVLTTNEQDVLGWYTIYAPGVLTAALGSYLLTGPSTPVPGTGTGTGRDRPGLFLVITRIKRRK